MFEKYCPFNTHNSIICFEQNCEKCGWNPKVEADRKQKNIVALSKKAQEKETTEIKQESVNLLTKSFRIPEQPKSDVSFGSWIAFKERKPDNYQQVLIYTKNRALYVATYLKNEELFKLNGCSRENREVRFWMPVPDLPNV